MSLRPGGRQGGQYSLEDGALTDSLALAIEEEFAAVYKGVKSGEDLPPTARKDMRLLFVGVARGVLRYLQVTLSSTARARRRASPSPTVSCC